ncbi:type IV secretion protein Rhs [Serratia ficaria]|uniref:type IV secretion protein Rhs n=1 Tax=Serratia ficaria TaxID=61651 RepID=UPI002ED40410|nr:type IV secretion protein Rhs [Serratia ficaria]
MEQQREGIKRALTPGEVNLARSVFGSSVFYEKVFVHCDSYLPFGLQNQFTAMSPNGQLYFRRALYNSNYANEDPEAQHLFIHEMAHVWQHQRGMWVRTRGLLSWVVSYQYRLDKPLLRHYSMEQQASLIADYFVLKKFGMNAFFGLPNRNYIGIVDRSTLSKFQPIIRSAGLPL